MNEYPTILIAEANKPLKEELLRMIEDVFNEDTDWEIGEPRIFPVSLITEQQKQETKKYKITVFFDPYFNVSAEEIHD